jgi:hypothetical protein
MLFELMHPHGFPRVAPFLHLIPTDPDRRRQIARLLGYAST